MKVFLIEDDPQTTESILLCFQVFNPDVKVHHSSQGLKALQTLREENDFDAVLIDLGLPDIDGMDVLEQLRSFSNVPAIIISARHSQEYVSKAMALGVNYYVTKPFNYHLLLDNLKTIFEAKPVSQVLKPYSK
jgi:two-component system KDP operon response regulator KdpE